MLTYYAFDLKTLLLRSHRCKSLKSPITLYTMRLNASYPRGSLLPNGDIKKEKKIKWKEVEISALGDSIEDHERCML